MSVCIHHSGSYFAASRVDSRKIWVKSYDGTAWEWEEVSAKPELPEAIVFEVLGSRRRIVFIEGERGSLDQVLYNILYPELSILPRGGCQSIINSTISMRQLTQLHHLVPSGLIDRDFRSDSEIAEMERSGVHVLPLAEVESLLCTIEVVQ